MRCSLVWTKYSLTCSVVLCGWDFRFSEILAGDDILSTPIFVTFLHRGLVQMSRYSAGESAHKSSAASGNTTPSDCMRRGQHLQGEHQQGLGEAQLLRTLPGKTVRICFCACANILLTHMFCQRQHYVDANILPAPNFVSAYNYCVCVHHDYYLFV